MTEYCIGSYSSYLHVIFFHFFTDGCGDDEAAAEGAYLGLWAYDFLKSKKESLKNLKIKPLEENNEQWQMGVKKAKGQNFARTLMETPANHLTPQIFARVSLIFYFYPIFLQEKVLEANFAPRPLRASKLHFESAGIVDLSSL